MAWGDKPTYAQVNCLYRWFGWHMTNDEAREASEWLSEHSSRLEFSAEMSRVKKLYDSHKLDRKTAFDSKVWNEYLKEKEDKK